MFIIGIFIVDSFLKFLIDFLLFNSPSQMMKAANVYPKKFVDKQQKQQLQQQQQKQRQQQQLVAVHWRKNRKIIGFFTTILIHMFGIKTRHLAHQRRESDQLNAMLEKQSKENQQNN